MTRFATLKSVCALMLWCLLVAHPARAEVRLCLSVKVDLAKHADFEKLVVAELGHHPSHVLVEQGCQARLKVELFEVGGISYLTARMDKEIPVRYEVRHEDQMAHSLSEALSMVLQNDPVYLTQDISHYSYVQRAAHSVLVRGHNSYRTDVFQDITFLGGRDVAMTAGGAFAVCRGSEHWQVLARIFAGGWPGSAASDARVVRALAGIQAGLNYEFSALSDITFYAGAGLGLRYLRFEAGREVAAQSSNTINQLLFGLDVRLGLRLFRTYDFDLDLFVGANIPFHQSQDEDGRFFDSNRTWTPSAQVGLGVGF